MKTFLIWEFAAPSRTACKVHGDDHRHAVDVFLDQNATADLFVLEEGRPLSEAREFCATYERLITDVSHENTGALAVEVDARDAAKKAVGS